MRCVSVAAKPVIVAVSFIACLVSGPAWFEDVDVVDEGGLLGGCPDILFAEMIRYEKD
jgi:hypothetical protein